MERHWLHAKQPVLSMKFWYRKCRFLILYLNLHKQISTTGKSGNQDTKHNQVTVKRDSNTGKNRKNEVKQAKVNKILWVSQILCNSLFGTLIFRVAGCVKYCSTVTGHQAKLMASKLLSTWASQKCFVYSAAVWNLFLECVIQGVLKVIGQHHVCINRTDTGINGKLQQGNIMQAGDNTSVIPTIPRALRIMSLVLKDFLSVHKAKLKIVNKLIISVLFYSKDHLLGDNRISWYRELWLPNGWL